MGTLASLRPDEWPLANSLDPVGWTSLRTALRVGAGCVLCPPHPRPLPQSSNVPTRAQGLALYPQLGCASEIVHTTFSALSVPLFLLRHHPSFGARPRLLQALLALTYLRDWEAYSLSWRVMKVKMASGC